MRPAKLFLRVGIASLISGLLLVSASFFPFASHEATLFRIVGGFFLIESTITLRLASNKRPPAKQDETTPVPAVRKQSWAWVGWCFLFIGVLFGGCYWMGKESPREDNADWKAAIAPYKRKDYVTAEAKLREFNYEHTDDWGWGHYYLALCLKHEGKIAEAREMFQGTMEQNYRKKDWGTNPTQNVYYKAQQQLKQLPPASPR